MEKIGEQQRVVSFTLLSLLLLYDQLGSSRLKQLGVLFSLSYLQTSNIASNGTDNAIFSPFSVE